MTDWEPELCDFRPDEFTYIEKENVYIQRQNIQEIEYHAIDGSETFHGYECFSRKISYDEYLLLKD